VDVDKQRKETIMADRLLRRLGAACGIFYVVLSIIGNDVLGGGGGAPAGFPSPKKVAAYYSNLPAPGVLDWAALFLLGLAVLCFMVFVAYLCSVLRRAEGEGSWLSTVALSGGLLTTVMLLGAFPPKFAVLLIRMYEELTPQVAATLYLLNDGAHVLTYLTSASLLAPTAIVVIRTRVLPRWLGWAAVVIAVGLPASLALWAYGFVAAPVLFLLLNLVWIIVVSVVLLRRARKPYPIGDSDLPGEPVRIR
jgi:hypothetical protein